MQRQLLDHKYRKLDQARLAEGIILHQCKIEEMCRKQGQVRLKEITMHQCKIEEKLHKLDQVHLKENLHQEMLVKAHHLQEVVEERFRLQVVVVVAVLVVEVYLVLVNYCQLALKK